VRKQLLRNLLAGEKDIARRFCFIRANDLFLKKHLYEKIMVYLVRQAYKQGLIKGKYVAMDSSFVHTFLPLSAQPT